MTPYGEWPSPVTAEAVVAASARLDGLQCVGDDVFWSERRPDEGGRSQVVRRRPDGTITDLLPDGANARTRVHEYGGGAWMVDGGRLFYNEWSDQRLYRLDLDRPGAEPVAISPAPASEHGYRHADMVVVGDWVVCVRERHDTGGEAANEIVGIHVDGAAEPCTIVTGPDFVASPRVNASGDKLAWFQWFHPNMPWDSTQAYWSELQHDADSIRMVVPWSVAGGPGMAVQDVRWHGDDLHHVSDESDWWNVYRGTADDTENLTPIEVEVGLPHWVFGRNRYDWLDDGRLVFAGLSGGTSALYVREHDGSITTVDQPYTEIESLQARGSDVVLWAGSPTSEPAVVAVSLDGTTELLRPSRDLPLAVDAISRPEPVSFPSNGRTAHGLYYPPTNPAVDVPDGPPPLLVQIHGGPTAAARAQLSLETQFFTSRGFAVIDVNYGGSTGFGRRYRRLLDDSWGIVDVEDAIAAATWLADQGKADRSRLCIRGGSAGGYTVLAALVASDAFAAGCDEYGIADITALAAETHKFESRYCDSLVGRLPEDAEIFEARSPINHVDRFETPLIVFQGLEDEVVPPNQSEMIVEALKSKGVPVAYYPFEGEQHGFRIAENIIRVFEAELAFYGEILGFTPADDLPPVEIHR